MQSGSDHSDSATPQGDVPTILEAIVRKLCIVATYNRVTMTIAPHILYTRHGDMFVDGVVVDREGRAPRELKLGSFKLAGMRNIATSTMPFVTLPDFSEADERYTGTALLAVETR